MIRVLINQVFSTGMDHVFPRVLDIFEPGLEIGRRLTANADIFFEIADVSQNTVGSESQFFIKNIFP